MWHFTRDGAMVGPVAHEKMCELFARSELPLETEVWHDGLSASVPAAQVEDFRQIWGKSFARPEATPPPLPAAPASQERPGLSPAAAPPRPSPNRRPRVVDDEEDRRDAPQVRPWVRYWARTLDNSIFALAVLFAVGPFPLIVFAAAFVGMLVGTPLQLWMFGTTIGKAILGVSVEREDGTRPTFGQAFGRESMCLLKGMGLCLPLVSLITLSVGYSRLVADGTTSWDTAAGLVVRHRPTGFLRWMGYWLVSAAVAVPVFLGTSGMSMADARSQRMMQALASFSPRRAEATPSVSITRTDVADPEPTTRPVAVKKKGKPKLLTLPSDKTSAKSVVKPAPPTTRPVRRLDRPAPSVIFKPDPAPES
jgi:uncharacterized RDD family membrane protein YckC